MIELTMASLFAGIGGFELSATWAGIKPIWSNEIDPWCCKVLRKNFNHEIIEKDIRFLYSDTKCTTIGYDTENIKNGKGRDTPDGFMQMGTINEIKTHELKKVDILTGGFPCQPFSHAGKRKGKDDNRYLWPEYLRLIRELQPSWIIAENVAGLISMENGRTLEGILLDLENENYTTEIYNIPACSVGAWHKRERIWIVAHANAGFCKQQESEIQARRYTFDNGCEYATNSIKFNDDKSGYGTGSVCGVGQTEAKIQGCKDVTDTNHPGPQRRHCKELSECRSERVTWSRSTQNNKRIWEFEPNVGRVANGISGRVDRLKGLGNAIVPAVAYEIFKAIVEYENNQVEMFE